MSCDPEQLSHYLDGELSSEEETQLRQHLGTCERCSADLAAYREVEDSVRRLGTKPAPTDLRRAIYRRIESRRSSSTWTRTALGGMARAAPMTAALVLVAGPVAAWRLLPSGAPPMMTAAFAVQEAPESLDGLRLELVFDRPVAADSVGQAVTVDPPLPLSQRVQENKVELIPRAPVPAGSAYKVTVNNVRDQRGNVQHDPVVLDLVAGPTARLIQASGSVETVRAAPGALTAAERGGLPTNLAHASSSVLDGNPDLQRRLGDPIGAERAAQVSEQAFQGGAMLTRPDTNQILVLVRPSGRWVSFANTWRPGEVLAPTGMRPAGTLEPLRGFGKLWRDQPAVKLQLGWPVYEERIAAGSIQNFANGTLVRSSHGVVYAVFGDGTWRTLPEPRP